MKTMSAFLLLILPMFVMAAPQGNWVYSTTPATTFAPSLSMATIESSNVLNFNFPYSGAQHPSLILRSDGDILVLFKGQVTCNDPEVDPEDCEVQVAFMHKDTLTIKKGVSIPTTVKIVKTFTINMPSDQSTGVFFIVDTKHFYAYLRKSDSVALNIQFYQEGTQEVDFNTAGLNVSKTQSWF